MARWEFVKQEGLKAYFVYKDGQSVCKIRFANSIIGKVYTVYDNDDPEGRECFSHLSEAKEYIKANY